MSTFPTGLELFEKFRPRFDQVRLVPVGWMREAYELCPKYTLGIYRGDTEVPWRDRYSRSYVHVHEASLQIRFECDHHSKWTIHRQFSQVVAEEVSRHLEGRTFRLRPGEPFTELYRSSTSQYESRKLVVEREGEPVPGLHFADSGSFEGGESGHWDSFVPRGTPEAEAIQSALIYHYKQTLAPRDVMAEQSAAEERLTAALSVVT